MHQIKGKNKKVLINKNDGTSFCPPYERRVIINCYDRHGVLKFKRNYVRLNTARKRIMDLAMDYGKVGDVFEIAHIFGLQYMTLKIRSTGKYVININHGVID